MSLDILTDVSERSKKHTAVANVFRFNAKLPMAQHKKKSQRFNTRSSIKSQQFNNRSVNSNFARRGWTIRLRR